MKGGYYPSIMQGLLRTGPYFTTLAISQGFRLIRNDTKRLANRSRKRKTNRKKSKSRR